MRNAFAKEITELAESDDRVILLSGDIGNRLFDQFKQFFPDRFYNCGVAEASMTGIAAGLASCGLKPVTYTIASFNTYRCLEQIKIDVCYHNLAVVIVGVGAGLSYAANGATHQSCEDIAILRAIPNMTVLCPADQWEVRAALRCALKYDGPVYLRLGKKNEPFVHENDPTLTIGTAIKVLDGDDVCIVSAGSMVAVAKDAVAILSKTGISAALYSFHTVKPLDENCLSRLYDKFPLLVTVEEHSIIGGLGGAVAEHYSGISIRKTELLRMGTPDIFLHRSGNQGYFRQCFDLNPASIAEKIEDCLKKLSSKGS